MSRVLRVSKGVWAEGGCTQGVLQHYSTEAAPVVELTARHACSRQFGEAGGSGRSEGRCAGAGIAVPRQIRAKSARRLLASVCAFSPRTHFPQPCRQSTPTQLQGKARSGRFMKVQEGAET